MSGKKPEWRAVEFFEAVEFIMEKFASNDYQHGKSYDNPEGRLGHILEFSDGSAVACVSNWADCWTDQYGFSTEAEPPLWFARKSS